MTFTSSTKTLCAHSSSSQTANYAAFGLLPHSSTTIRTTTQSSYPTGALKSPIKRTIPPTPLEIASFRHMKTWTFDLGYSISSSLSPDQKAEILNPVGPWDEVLEYDAYRCSDESLKRINGMELKRRRAKIKWQRAIDKIMYPDYTPTPDRRPMWWRREAEWKDGAEKEEIEDKYR